MGSSNLTVLYSYPLRLGTPGVGMTAWHQVTGLVKAGFIVHLFAGSCEKPIPGLATVHQTLVPFGLRLPIRFLGPFRAAALHDLVVAGNIRRISGSVDVIHCWPSGALKTLGLARQLGITSFIERCNTHTRFAMDVVDLECRKLGVKMPRRHSHTLNTRRLYREEKEFDLAKLLLCPSDFVVSTFRAKGFPDDKLVRHQYGHDPAVFSPKGDADGQAEQGTFSLLFAGSCEPRKGLHYALDAWLHSEASKSGTFYICGKFLRSYERVLREKLSHRSIKILSYTLNVAALMQRSHALILPSIEEGAPLVTYEARACGCVLVVSEPAAAACKHMETGLVHKVGDVDTIRQHIDLLFSDRNLYLRLQRNSLATIDDYTWDKAGKRLADVYIEYARS